MARGKLTKTEAKATAERKKKFFDDKENNPDKDLEEKTLDKRKEFVKQSHMNRFPTVSRRTRQAEEAFAREDKEDFKKGGLARKRRKSDGGLKVGQRKIARGCGKVQRRKKTLYT